MCPPAPALARVPCAQKCCAACVSTPAPAAVRRALALAHLELDLEWEGSQSAGILAGVKSGEILVIKSSMPATDEDSSPLFVSVVYEGLVGGLAFLRRERVAAPAPADNNYGGSELSLAAVFIEAAYDLRLMTPDSMLTPHEMEAVVAALDDPRCGASVYYASLLLRQALKRGCSCDAFVLAGGLRAVYHALCRFGESSPNGYEVASASVLATEAYSIMMHGDGDLTQPEDDAALAEAALRAMVARMTDRLVVASCCDAASCAYCLKGMPRADPSPGARARAMALLATAVRVWDPADADATPVEAILSCVGCVLPQGCAGWGHTMALCRAALALVRAHPARSKAQTTGLRLLSIVCASDPEAMAYARARGAAALCARTLRMHAYDAPSCEFAAHMLACMGPGDTRRAMEDVLGALRSSADDEARILRFLRILSALCASAGQHDVLMVSDFVPAMDHALRHVSAATPRIYAAAGRVFSTVFDSPQMDTHSLVLQPSRVLCVLVARAEGHPGAVLSPAAVRAICRAAQAAADGGPLVAAATTAALIAMGNECIRLGVRPPRKEHGSLDALLVRTLQSIKKDTLMDTMDMLQLDATEAVVQATHHEGTWDEELRREEEAFFDSVHNCVEAETLERVIALAKNVLDLLEKRPRGPRDVDSPAGHRARLFLDRMVWVLASVIFREHGDAEQLARRVGKVASANAAFYSNVEQLEVKVSSPTVARLAWLRAERRHASSVHAFALTVVDSITDGGHDRDDTEAAIVVVSRANDLAASARECAFAVAEPVAPPPPPIRRAPGPAPAALELLRESARLQTEREEREAEARQLDARAAALEEAERAARAAATAAAERAAAGKRRALRAQAEAAKAARVAAEKAAKGRSRSLAAEAQRRQAEERRAAAAAEDAARLEAIRTAQQVVWAAEEAERAEKLAAEEREKAEAKKEKRRRYEARARAARAEAAAEVAAGGSSSTVPATSAAASSGSSSPPASPRAPDAAAAAPAAAPSTKCVVCLDDKNTHMCFPCTHMSLCGGCAAQIMRSTARCPMCRAKVTAMVVPLNAGAE